jgi:hypothetical protein
VRFWFLLTPDFPTREHIPDIALRQQIPNAIARGIKQHATPLKQSAAARQAVSGDHSSRKQSGLCAESTARTALG